MVALDCVRPVKITMGSTVVAGGVCKRQLTESRPAYETLFAGLVSPPFVYGHGLR